MAVALNSLRSGQSSTMVRTRSRVAPAASGVAGRSIRRTKTARWAVTKVGTPNTRAVSAAQLWSSARAAAGRPLATSFSTSSGSTPAEAREWAAPAELALGCVADPFGPDSEAELALLGRTVAAGADFVQTQMVFDPAALAGFLDRAAEGG